jgi:hypothetical protein
MKQRTILFFVVISVTTVLLPGRACGQQSSQGADPNERICAEKFALAEREHWNKLPINEVVAAVGKSFLGVPYAAGTLEAPGEERLVVQLQTLDCVLLYENSLALARCIKKGTTTYEAFKTELRFIRYRSGVLNGFPSRLHYTSDYFFDNEQKHVLKNITGELGGVPHRKSVHFMTTHPESYPALQTSPLFLQQMKDIETEINKRTALYLPKNQVARAAAHIEDGDILGITTTIDGMDCSHTGIALWKNGTLHMLHAPHPGAEVQVTATPLSEYLTNIKKDTGIMVERAVEP